MRRALMLSLVVAMVLVSSMSFAGMRSFTALSVYVPDGWTAQEEATGVIAVISNDVRTVIYVEVAMDSRDLRDIATDTFTLTDGATGEIASNNNSSLYMFGLESGGSMFIFGRQYSPNILDGLFGWAMVYGNPQVDDLVSILKSLAINVPINTEIFPDEAFMAYVKASFDENGDGTLNYLDIPKATTIIARDKGIKSLQGIEYLPRLVYLDCRNNQLDTLDLSKNHALRTLICYSNDLTSLDVSGCTNLQKLYCFNNQLVSLDVSNNTALTRLECYNNQLTELDLRHNTALTYLSCHYNPLNELNVRGCTSIQTLFLYNMSDFP